MGGSRNNANLSFEPFVLIQTLLLTSSNTWQVIFTTLDLVPLEIKVGNWIKWSAST